MYRFKAHFEVLLGDSSGAKDNKVKFQKGPMETQA